MATRAPLTETVETELRPSLLAPGGDDDAEDERPYVCRDCDGFGCCFCRDGGEDL